MSIDLKLAAIAIGVYLVSEVLGILSRKVDDLTFKVPIVFWDGVCSFAGIILLILAIHPIWASVLIVLVVLTLIGVHVKDKYPEYL